MQSHLGAAKLFFDHYLFYLRWVLGPGNNNNAIYKYDILMDSPQVTDVLHLLGNHYVVSHSMRYNNINLWLFFVALDSIRLVSELSKSIFSAWIHLGVRTFHSVYWRLEHRKAIYSCSTFERKKVFTEWLVKLITVAKYCVEV